MKAQDALTEFECFADAKGKKISDLSPRDAVELMAGFYSAFRSEECDLEADGDMLLFQWGVYDWGEGEMFEFNITRQFMFPMVFEEDGEKWEEDSIWQLSLTCKCVPSESLRNLGANNRWCSSPDELVEFLRFAQKCEATSVAGAAECSIVKLTFNQQ